MILIKGVILAGGTGSRLSPLTKVTNKHLLPVYDEPMIFKGIKTLTRSGINDITIVLGGESIDKIVSLLGDGSDFDAKFRYVYQKRAGGIAEALYLTKDIVEGNKVAVILGDNIFEDIFKSEVEKFKSSNDCECFLFLKEVSDTERFGIAEFNKDNAIKSIEEKPHSPKSNYAVTGLYLYDQNIFTIIDHVNKEIGYSKSREMGITAVNNCYIKRGKIKTKIINGFWTDAGTFNSLLKASNFIQSTK